MIRFFSFWLQLWPHKWLFICISCFVLGQFFFTIKGVESFPFHNFGMYSAPMPIQDSIPVLSLKINDQLVELSALPGRSRALIEYQLKYYRHLQKQDYKDPIHSTIENRLAHWLSPEQLHRWKEQLSNNAGSAKALGPWLKRYLQPTYPQNIQKIELIEQYFDAKAPYPKLHSHAQLLYPI